MPMCLFKGIEDMFSDCKSLCFPFVFAAMFTLVVLACGLSSPAAADTAKTKAELRAHFERVSKLLDKQDVEGLAAMVDSSATFVFSGGKSMTVEQWKEATRKAFFQMSNLHSSIKLNSLVERGKAVEA